MDKHLVNVLLAFVISMLCSCSGGGGGDQSSNTMYLARNVILRGGLVTSAFAQSTAIDTTTQISASNVIYETSEASQISSGNVQSALEEISLKFSEVMVGTWNIQNYNQGTRFFESTGRIIIYNNGTFNLTAGSFAAVGMGSGTAPDPTCNHTGDQTYEVFTEGLTAFSYTNGIVRSIIPRLVRLRQNEIILVGEGGCGELGTQRVSILTRVQ